MSNTSYSRQELVGFVDEFRDKGDASRRKYLGKILTRCYPDADVVNLCESDLSSATIVDFCSGVGSARRILHREELVALVGKIMDLQVTSEAEDMLMLETFLFNCRHPAGSDLIYYPEEVFGRSDEITAEMIVAQALKSQ